MIDFKSLRDLIANNLLPSFSVERQSSPQVVESCSPKGLHSSVLCWISRASGVGYIMGQKIEENGLIAGSVGDTLLYSFDSDERILLTSSEDTSILLAIYNSKSISVAKLDRDFRIQWGDSLVIPGISRLFPLESVLDSYEDFLSSFDKSPRIYACNGHIANPRLFSDGTGGAFLIWQLLKRDGISIYAQWINKFGTKMWRDDLLVAESLHRRSTLDCVGDGKHFMITWDDRTRTDWNIFARAISLDDVRRVISQTATASQVFSPFVLKEASSLDSDFSNSDSVSSILPVCIEKGVQRCPKVACWGPSFCIFWTDGEMDNTAIGYKLLDRHGKGMDGGILYLEGSQQLIDVIHSARNDTNVAIVHKSTTQNGQSIDMSFFRPDTAFSIQLCDCSHLLDGTLHFCTDGSSFSYFFWQKKVKGEYQLYAQLVNMQEGVAYWQYEGKTISRNPRIAECLASYVDYGGNAIYAFQLNINSGDSRVFAQKLTPLGHREWNPMPLYLEQTDPTASPTITKFTLENDGSASIHWNETTYGNVGFYDFRYMARVCSGGHLEDKKIDMPPKTVDRQARSDNWRNLLAKTRLGSSHTDTLLVQLRDSLNLASSIRGLTQFNACTGGCGGALLGYAEELNDSIIIYLCNINANARVAYNVRVASASGSRFGKDVIFMKVIPASDGTFVLWGMRGHWNGLYVSKVKLDGTLCWQSGPVSIGMDYSNAVCDKKGSLIIAGTLSYIISQAQGMAWRAVVVQKIGSEGRKLLGEDGLVVWNGPESPGGTIQLATNNKGEVLIGWKTLDHVLLQKLDIEGNTLWNTRRP
jgi:hypothetical protein